MNSDQPIHEIGFRDAIHVPFIVVTCKLMTLAPGDKCSLRGGDDEPVTCVKWGGGPEKTEWGDGEPMWHGVADPWRESPIKAGEPFPLYLRKECFGKLRHDFQIEVHDCGGTETCHSVCNIF